MSEWSDWSDVDSSFSCSNGHMEEINHYMVMAYQHKIDLLTQIIETKNRELLIKDKDLEILKLQLEHEIKEKNSIIRDLLKQLELYQNKSEWV